MELLSSVEACSIGFNQSPRQSRPNWLGSRDALASLGPLLDGSMMSGSGSAYFGLCPDSAAARRAAEILKTLGLGWVRVVTCPPQAANAP